MSGFTATETQRLVLTGISTKICHFLFTLLVEKHISQCLLIKKLVLLFTLVIVIFTTLVKKHVSVLTILTQNLTCGQILVKVFRCKNANSYQFFKYK